MGAKAAVAMEAKAAMVVAMALEAVALLETVEHLPSRPLLSLGRQRRGSL